MNDGIIALHLTSKDGKELSPPTQKSSIAFSLKRSIDVPAWVVWVAVTGGIIPRSSYVIDDNNDAFQITVNGIAYDITLTHGNPSAFQLATDCQNKLVAVTGLSFVVTYSTSTNKLTFSVPDATYSNVSIDFPTGSTCYRPLGFTVGTHSFTLAGGTWSHESEGVVNLATTPSCSIHMEGMIFSDALTTDGQSSILDRVYFSRPPNALEILGANGIVDYKLARVPSGSIPNMIITIRDSDGNLMDFNNVDWELSLAFKSIPVPLSIVSRLDMGGLGETQETTPSVETKEKQVVQQPKSTQA